MAARYELYLKEHPGHKLNFDQILNLNEQGQLGGAKKRKSKKVSKKNLAKRKQVKK